MCLHSMLVSLQTDDLVTPAMDDDARQGVADWESLTYDRTQWTLLVRQLQDLLVLQCLLKVSVCCSVILCCRNVSVIV